MQDEPTPEELTKAVADFLRNDIAPEIGGHNAFKLRVAINVLDLVTRQLKLGQGSDAAEAARLTRLLGMEGSLIELNRALSDKIAKGEDPDIPVRANDVIDVPYSDLRIGPYVVYNILTRMSVPVPAF